MFCKNSKRQGNTVRECLENHSIVNQIRREKYITRHNHGMQLGLAIDFGEKRNKSILFIIQFIG